MSQVRVLLKRLNVGSHKQHHTIAQGLQFSDAKDLREIRPGSPPTRAPNAGGVGQNRRLSTNNRLYLDKKLSYRRGTARYVVSIEILPIATQQPVINKPFRSCEWRCEMQKMGWFGVVRGHSRSTAMSPFDRAHTTSYSTLIETMRLSCTVFKI